MTLPNSLLSYQAQLEFMDLAMDAPNGKRMFFRREAEAERFKIKCNYARVLHRRENKLIHEPGTNMYGKSEYDVLVFTTKWSVDPEDPKLNHYWVYAKKEILDTSRIEDIPEDEESPPIDTDQIEVPDVNQTAAE